ncbi:uncharacterized protein LOC124121411 [Haliotis rufescens]|uniref:uncharacterized protein LOC124121411 n=1 Tax=Haliotis rufescens TaxID=6454 RepID=UPI00201EBC33|nr:uncharacterized protein LOC124121411 [Haliotis rufescens]
MITTFKEKKQALKILVFGPTACGKSSLCNGLKMALDKETEVSHFFQAGRSETASYTKDFQFTTWEDCVTLYDMAGVFETEVIKDEDILNIIQGKVAFTGKLSNVLKPTPQASSEAQTNVSCVVIVLKPGMQLPENVKRIITLVHRTGGEGELACHVVLTHLDEVEDCFKDPENLNQLFSSAEVQRKVEHISREVGLPPNAISFVRNHSYETQSDTKSTVLFLHTFKQIIKAACDQEDKRARFAAAVATQNRGK